MSFLFPGYYDYQLISSNTVLVGYKLVGKQIEPRTAQRSSIIFWLVLDLYFNN